MKRREFYKGTVDIIQTCRHEMQENDAEIARIQKKIDSGKYSQEGIAPMRDKVEALKKRNRDEVERALRSINKDIQTMRASLDDELVLRGSDVTPDAKLLDFNLDANELISIIDRHKDNPTMIQLCLKNAKDRGINLGIYFTANEAEQNILRSIEYAAKVTLRNYNSDHVFDELFGEGSAVADVFNTDDRPPAAPLAYSDERIANAARMLRENLLSPNVQADIIREFESQPDILPILRNAAIEGGNPEAVNTANHLLGIDAPGAGE